MIELCKKLNDGRYVFDKDGVIFCVTERQVREMLGKIHVFEWTQYISTKTNEGDKK